MKLHYELFKSNNTSLSECIGIYDNVISMSMCEELIEWFEESKTIRVDDQRKQSTEFSINTCIIYIFSINKY